MLFHLMDFYIYQTPLECYDEGSKFTMTQKNVIVLSDSQFIFGRLWQIKQDEASLVDKDSEANSGEENLTRETLQIKFFRKFLSQFRREMIQCFDLSLIHI